MWMTAEPYCVTADYRLDAVAAAMERGRFRQVPVVDDARRLIGIVTARDLRQHVGYWESTKVSAAMTEPAIAVRPDDPIELAARILLERKIGGLPVVDQERRVVGVLTTSDLLRGFLHGVGGAEYAARIDFRFAGTGQSFAEAVRVVEAAGSAVLGLGTFDDTADSGQKFFVRVAAAGAERAADALRAAGFVVTALHAPRP
jgi:acetoin utilization protein AcuB